MDGCRNTLLYILLIWMLCVGSTQLHGQILSPKQELAVKKTITDQFGVAASEPFQCNLGASNLCVTGGDTLYNPAGYNYVFHLAGDTLVRLDHSLFHGNNGRRFLFAHKQKLYALGGYGFFTTNNHLLYFNRKSREWCYEPTRGEAPPHILGITFKSGGGVYSFNNYRSGNNAEPDAYDKGAYRLDLESMTWKKISGEAEISGLQGECYYATDYVFFHGRNRSALILCSEKKFVLLQNDACGLAPNAYVEAIDGNVIYIRKFDNTGKPDSLRMDLSKMWQQHGREVKVLFDGPAKPSAGFAWMAALAGSIVAGGGILLLRLKKKRGAEAAGGGEGYEVQENSPVTRSELLTLVLNSQKRLLSTDELDELLKISHLEADSRKLRRHRLLSEIQKEFPGLIERVKDSGDRRRFMYRINTSEQAAN